MKTFYVVTLIAFVIGMAIVCGHAPWTTTPVGSTAVHDALGYAAIWSDHFAAVPGARVDRGALGILAGGVGFFAVVLGAIAYAFRGRTRPNAG